MELIYNIQIIKQKYIQESEILSDISTTDSYISNYDNNIYDIIHYCF